MSTMREELHRLVESLSEDELSEVREFAKLLLKEPDELTEDERGEVKKGRASERNSKRRLGKVGTQGIGGSIWAQPER